jgi:hypothetical protein
MRLSLLYKVDRSRLRMVYEAGDDRNHPIFIMRKTHSDEEVSRLAQGFGSLFRPRSPGCERSFP